MQLRHNALLVVADGRKALFLRNDGDAVYPKLTVEHAEQQVNPPDRDQKTDRPGRAFSSVGDGRSAMEEPDYHQIEEDRFAAELGAMLKARALAGEFETLIVAAPPRTLGELRKHYHVEVEKRLTGEIAKDLTNHPLDEIEKLVTAG